MSSSGSSLERAIDEYLDTSSRSEGSYEGGEGSISNSGSSSSDEHYSFGVPGIPSEEFQEMQRRTASGARTSSSKEPPSSSQ